MARVHIRKNAPTGEIGYCLLVMMSQPADLVLQWCKTCAKYREVEGALDAQGIYKRCMGCGERFD